MPPLQVNVSGMKSIEAQIRITEPAKSVPVRGTVLLGSGGGGESFYAASAGVPTLVKNLSAIGFRVVDRFWTGGWMTHEGGFKEQSCRYASLLTWVHDHLLERGGKLVATGNSGGALEIAYALTTWRRGDILDLVVPTGGMLATLDYVCVREASPEWSALCASIVPRGAMECEPKCMFNPSTTAINDYCTQISSQPTMAQLRADNVMNEDAVLHYPKTRVHFLFGARDCFLPTVPMTLTYAAKITSDKLIEFVPNTPHGVFSTPEGRAAILKAIDTGTSSPNPRLP
jgi:hypothetical protein